MDQVSPALQFCIDKVETCSWESSSPQRDQSPCESIPAGACSADQGHPPAQLVKPEIYTVMTVESNPSESRDSTAEPLTPAGLQVLQEEESVVCKEEKDSSDYSCGMLPCDASGSSNGENTKTKKKPYGAHASSMDDIDTFGDYQTQMVEVPPSTSSEPPVTKCADICSIPQCLRFGTYIVPEQQDKNIMISLEGAELWHQFYQAGTEMIITKSGRRMFPGIVISVGGLEPDLKYSIALEFNPVDNARYKYINTKWVNIGKAEAHCEDLLRYNHPESPSSGKHWMSSKISFKKIKVTNNKNHKKGQVVALNSMHKYQPRVVISRFISKKIVEPIFTQDLVECTFIGVTAYQNDQVTQLKIDHNPFAKAFRESGSDDSYGYGMMGSWPPISPLLSPYGSSFTPDGQALPMLSPSCIPSAGSSPLPQFNSAFCSWESPPYSPGANPYRSAFPGTGSLPFPDPHRQMISSRLLAQESPPISPLLYTPTAFPQSHQHHHQHHHQLTGQPPTINIGSIGSHQFSNLASSSISQQKPPPASSVPEIWTAKSDYSGTDNNGSFEASGSPVGYNCQQVNMKTSLVGHQQGVFCMPKIEPVSSPAELGMDVQP